MTTVREIEKQLAVMTSWFIFAILGFCLMMSGWTSGSWILSLVGLIDIIVGFIVHVIINAKYRTNFSMGEIIIGFSVFSIALLYFLSNLIFNTHVERINIIVYLLGLSALIVCVLVYLITKNGIKEILPQFNRQRGGISDF